MKKYENEKYVFTAVVLGTHAVETNSLENQQVYCSIDWWLRINIARAYEMEIENENDIVRENCTLQCWRETDKIFAVFHE